MTLKMTSAQVVETSVIVNNNSSFQNYTNPDDHTQQTTNISKVHNVLLRNNRFWNKIFLLFFQYAIFFANKNTVEYSKVTLLSV